MGRGGAGVRVDAAREAGQVSAAAGRPGPDLDRRGLGPSGTTVRVSAKVYRRLLTIQYQRKMAGDTISLNGIITELLDKAGAA